MKLIGWVLLALAGIAAALKAWPLVLFFAFFGLMALSGPFRLILEHLRLR